MRGGNTDYGKDFLNTAAELTKQNKRNTINTKNTRVELSPYDCCMKKYNGNDEKCVYWNKENTIKSENCTPNTYKPRNSEGKIINNQNGSGKNKKTVKTVKNKNENETSKKSPGRPKKSK